MRVRRLRFVARGSSLRAPKGSFKPALESLEGKTRIVPLYEEHDLYMLAASSDLLTMVAHRLSMPNITVRGFPATLEQP